jgi:hypothetical protein
MNKRKITVDDDLSDEFNKRLKLSDPIETLELCIAEMNLRIKQLELQINSLQQKHTDLDIYWETVVS